MSVALSQTPVAVNTPKTRIGSIDLIRGAVMILMAIDHVRVYSGVPPGGPTPGVFFTRWITHFCAPAFIFLAGTSTFLYGRKHADVSRYLLTRGIWLIFLEFTFLRVFWTFNFDFLHYEMERHLGYRVLHDPNGWISETAAVCGRRDWWGHHRGAQLDGFTYGRAARRP